MTVNPRRVTANPAYVPPWTTTVVPAGATSTACWMVRHGAVAEPSAPSEPVVETYTDDPGADVATAAVVAPGVEVGVAVGVAPGVRVALGVKMGVGVGFGAGLEVGLGRGRLPLVVGANDEDGRLRIAPGPREGLSAAELAVGRIDVTRATTTSRPRDAHLARRSGRRPVAEPSAGRGWSPMGATSLWTAPSRVDTPAFRTSRRT